LVSVNLIRNFTDVCREIEHNPRPIFQEILLSANLKTIKDGVFLNKQRLNRISKLRIPGTRIIQHIGKV